MSEKIQTIRDLAQPPVRCMVASNSEIRSLGTFIRRCGLTMRSVYR